MTSTTPTPTLAIPPLAAIFLTHFDDTKGQSVIYYKSIDDTRIPRGTIEHTTLPSGLHLVEEDLFGFRHPCSSTSASSGSGSGSGSGDKGNDLPGLGLFRSRNTGDDGQIQKGRGRRMATLGVVLADTDLTERGFELEPWLSGVYDQIENDQIIIEGVLSSHPDSGMQEEGQKRLSMILDGLWDRFGSESIPDLPKGHGIRAGVEVEKRMRKLADDRASTPANHPIKYLPDLLDILGPQFTTVYKAAISGRRILIYSPPPLLPISAFGWCICAISLPPSSASEGIGLSRWLGQVGLMDLEGLKGRKGGWVASTSDKILLSHTKAYDLSIDLSASIPLSDSNGDTRARQVEIRYTSPSSPTPILTNYQFSDIPLYKSLTPSGAVGSDWWITIYDLVDRVWIICAGVCEYAVGRGQVGQVSLGDGEDDSLLPGDEDEDEDEGEGQVGNVQRGRMMLRQLYHQTYHLHARLSAIQAQGQGEGGLTIGQVRQLSGKWMIKNEDVQFWMDLSRYWEACSGSHLSTCS